MNAKSVYNVFYLAAAFLLTAWIFITIKQKEKKSEKEEEAVEVSLT